MPSCSVLKQAEKIRNFGPFTKYVTLFLPIFYPPPPPTPCDSAWQLAVHPIIEYATLSQLYLPPLYSDTDFNALLNLSLNSLTPDQTPPYPHERHVFCEWLNGPFPQMT